jgi:hypothetical protein
MTENIGKFTAAGVGLETSVLAIKGIANLSAVSGATAQQASSAMYQLSQALSTGVVKLQDWNSVVNAGIGGEVFKNALIETARVHDVAIDAMIESAGGFRGTLQEGWLTSDILLETLSKFTGDLTAAQIESLGYNEEQVAEILALGKMSLAAATDIKTLTQLADTLYEALQSGWSGTWRIILGDFEESKELFGGIGDLLSGVIGESAEARNSQLAFWSAAGGRESLIKSFTTSMTSLLNISKLFKDAVGDVFEPFQAGNLLKITDMISKLVERFKVATWDGDNFKSIIRGIASAVDILFMVVRAVLKPLGEFLVTLGPNVDALFDYAAGIGDFLYSLRNRLKETGELDVIVENVISKFKEWSDATRELFNESKFISLLIEQIQKIGMIDLSGLNLGENFKSVLDRVKELIANLNIDDFAKKIKDQFESITNKVRDLRDSLDFSGIKNSLGSIFSAEGSRLVEFIEYAKVELPKLRESLSFKQEINIEESEGPGALLEFLENDMQGILDSLAERITNFDFGTLIDAISAGLLGSLVLAIRNKVAGEGITDKILNAILGTGSGFESITDGIVGSLDSLKDTFAAYQKSLKADALLKIGKAIGLITASVVALSFIDSDKLLNASIAMGAMMTSLFAGVAILGALSSTGMATSVIAIIGIAGALAVLSSSLAIISLIDPDKMASALLIATAGLTLMVVTIKALSAGTLNKGMLVASLAIRVLSSALVVMAGALETLGKLQPDEAATGLLVMAGALGIITGFAMLLPNKRMIAASISIGIMSLSLGVFADVIREFASFTYEEMTRGLTILAGGLAIIGGAIQLFSGKEFAIVGLSALSISLGFLTGVLSEALTELSAIEGAGLLKAIVALGAALAILVFSTNLMTGGLAGAAALVVVAGAVVILAAGLKILGELSWEGILKALAALTGVFVILGLAGLILGPILPIILGLAITLGLLGVAVLAIGAGLFLAGLGLTAFAAGGGLAAGVIVGIVAVLISVLPQLVIALATAITDFIIEMGNRTPEIVDAALMMFEGLLTAIVMVVPMVVEAIYELLLALIEAMNEYIPDILDAGFTLLTAILDGIANHIGDVITAALDVVQAIIKGLTDGIPDLVIASFEMILTFIDGLTDAVEEYYPKIVSAGLRLAYALIEGMVEGLVLGLVDVVKSMLGLSDGMVETFEESWGIHSPSKVAYELVQKIILGMVNSFFDSLATIKEKAKEVAQSAVSGIKSGIAGGLEGIKTEAGTMGSAIIDGIKDKLQSGITDVVNKMINVANAAINGFKEVWGINSPSKVAQGFATNIINSFSDRISKMSGTMTKSMTKMGLKSQNGMSLVMDSLSQIISDSDLEPTIRPVLDMGSVDSGLLNLDKRFGSYSIAGNISSDIRQSERQSTKEEPVQHITNETEVTYNQYNTSPKNLTPTEIYRNTKSQLAKLKRKP